MTTTTHVRALDHTIELTNIWLHELADELGTDSREDAYRVTRGFFHALRDRIGSVEAAELAAQLPELMAGVFYKGWQPRRTPKRYGERVGFLQQFAAEASIVTEADAVHAAAAAFRVMCRHVSNGEVEDVLALLPDDVRETLVQLTVHASS